MPTHAPSRRPSLSTIVRSFLGAFLGLAAVVAVDRYWLFEADMTMVIGSFGATAVLLYAAPSSPLAQPFNLIVGHAVSAAIGVAVFQMVGEANWISISLSVSGAIAAMQLTRSLHPPGGATALIAVVGSDGIHALGFGYILFPVLSGAFVMLAVALVANNLFKEHTWPLFWWPVTKKPDQ